MVISCWFLYGQFHPFLKMYPVIKLWITPSIHLSALKMTLFLTSAILVCLLFVVDPKTCSCSSRFRSSSIWSFALAFCTLRCAFCSSNSRNLFVTQSLIRAALASTALASASRKAFCKKRPKRPKFRKTFGTVLYYLVGVTLKDLDLCAFLKSLLGFFSCTDIMNGFNLKGKHCVNKYCRGKGLIKYFSKVTKVYVL